MKKVFLYMLLIAGMAAAVSCSKNLPPVFDDANAFVAFDQANAALDEAIIKEDGTIVPQTETIKIPVTLGSVKGPRPSNSRSRTERRRLVKITS